MSEIQNTGPARPTIWFAMEFHGNGDPMFGGSAADWALYDNGETGRVFMSGADAQRGRLVEAYFTNSEEAVISGEAYSKRGGSISALVAPENALFSPASIGWLRRRSVEVHDTDSGLGGSFTVEIVEDLSADRVKVRVWYGRATPNGWEC